MRLVRHRLGLAVVTLAVTLGAVSVRSARAGAVADEIDDPKMARIYQAPPPAAEKAAAVQGPAARVDAPKPVVPRPPEAPKVEPAKVVAAKAETPPPAVAALPPAASPPAAANARSAAPAAGVDVAARPSGEGEAAGPTGNRAWPHAPRLKLAYRHFPFARAGASAGATAGAPTSESFESVSIDLYPISWYLRVGLSTQFGWESEKFDRSGDYFIAETASVGFQVPGRFTPFVEALAGAGYMRRVMADRNLPTAYWQVGVDAGVEIYLANRAYISVAAGYLHPGNLFVVQSSLMSVKTDSWSLKFGVGI